MPDIPIFLSVVLLFVSSLLLIMSFGLLIDSYSATKITSETKTSYINTVLTLDLLI